MDALMVAMVAACSAGALALLVTSALGLVRADRGDPSDEARAMTLALYGCAVAVATLGMFVTLL
ncbi:MULTISPECIES: hypothetical protein [unclassified Streptomyces]|uniref:hypothetical protein n=1 Tax=unclassified Streptomyces TaxID=2593676 RepID=UPI00332AE0A0